jgi:uncharacterized protein (UPF0297 family)
MSISESEQELSEILKTNQLPFYACVKNDQTTSHIYLYDVFEADCLFTKCYNNSGPVVKYLLHQRPSYVTSDSNFTTSIAHTHSSYADFMFSDIVNIPYNYHGKIQHL